MENGRTNGARTDHDRERHRNGMNDRTTKTEEGAMAGGASVLEKPGVSTTKPSLNGGANAAMEHGESRAMSVLAPSRAPRPSKMNDLPEEIQHITTEMMPLGLLISRLAQVSHNQVQEVISELAMKQIPPVAVNGSGPDYRNTNVEDSDTTSLEKKALLLHFVQNLHAKWVKALVITDWSKKAGQVSKLIDIKAHMEQQLHLYDNMTDSLVDMKAGLAYARLPSPDLKTALQVLKTGEAPWMPELAYIEPQPMTAEEQLHWVEDLNTLLAVRLSLEEYERIPLDFRDYTIASGRVTFTVQGEFEVDLTIADEDFEQQFWFIDFRFSFRPAPPELSDGLRAYLEAQTNERLAAEGLVGCYNLLHEFVLTHKITEFMRQALELSRGRWADTLRVERVNRALSIQYWATRPLAPTAAKSWFLLGVESRRSPGLEAADQSRSRLSLRWFRDGKEVKDPGIAFDAQDISAEALIKAVVGRHIALTLSAIHAKFAAKPRFAAAQEGALRLSIDQAEPMNSALAMPLFGEERLVARMDVVTGLFSLQPHGRSFHYGEQRLSHSRDAGEEGVEVLESLRVSYIHEELQRRGRSSGWSTWGSSLPPPMKNDELRPMVQTRDAFQAIWLRRQGWLPQWMVVLTLSLAGDRWFLVKLSWDVPTAPRLVDHFPLAMQLGDDTSRSTSASRFSSSFFRSFTLMATSMIAFALDWQRVTAKGLSCSLRQVEHEGRHPRLRMPGLWIRLSDIVPASGGGRSVWAEDCVCVFVTKVCEGQADRAAGSGVSASAAAAKADGLLDMVAEARIRVKDKTRFAALAGQLGRDIAFHGDLGVFALRLRVALGQSLLDALQSRLRALERLVDFVEAVRKQDRVRCHKATISEVVFTYSDRDMAPASPDEEAAGGEGGGGGGGGGGCWTARLDLGLAQLSLQPRNPHNRILDMLNSLVLTQRGLEKLPYWLPTTLPLLRGLDALNEAWMPLTAEHKGHVEIMHRDLDALVICFHVYPRAATNAGGAHSWPAHEGRAATRVSLLVELRQRKDEPWWQIHDVAPDAHGGADNNPDQPRFVPDAEGEYAKALSRHVWNGKGDGWRGLCTGAAAAPYGGGIENLLGTIDSVMRDTLDGGGGRGGGGGGAGGVEEASDGTAGAAGWMGSPLIISEQSNATTAGLTAPGTSFSQSSAVGGVGASQATQLTQMSTLSQGGGQSHSSGVQQYQGGAGRNGGAGKAGSNVPVVILD